MADGYHMTSSVKFPKSAGGNYIAGVRFNRHDHEFEFVFKDSGKIIRKMDIGKTATFIGYLSKNLADGSTGISKDILGVIVRFLVANRGEEVSREFQEFRD